MEPVIITYISMFRFAIICGLGENNQLVGIMKNEHTFYFCLTFCNIKSIIQICTKEQHFEKNVMPKKKITILLGFIQF